MPGALLHPRSRVQDALKNAHTSIQVQPEQPGIPCAMVLRLMPSSPWRRIPLASIADELTVRIARLGACKPPPAWHQPRVPEPHGFAVRSFLRHRLQPAKCVPAEAIAKAFKRRSSARDVHSRKPALRTPFAPDAAASTATRPNVRDDGQRPSSRDGMAGVVGVIWDAREAEYFCGQDWTGQIRLKLLEKIAHSRNATPGCRFAHPGYACC